MFSLRACCVFQGLVVMAAMLFTSRCVLARTLSSGVAYSKGLTSSNQLTTSTKPCVGHTLEHQILKSVLLAVSIHWLFVSYPEFGGDGVGLRRAETWTVQGHGWQGRQQPV